MVRIDKVYTKGGDGGQTSLVGGERVAKDAPRIECYGTVDELNACIGLVVANLAGNSADAELRPIMLRIQNELFNLGAQLATPDEERRARSPGVGERHVAALEADIDRLNAELPPLKSFVLPGGGKVSAHLHLARTVCRRAERLLVSLERAQGTSDASMAYLNRLSDALFVFARWAAHQAGEPETLWIPEKA